MTLYQNPDLHMHSTFSDGTDTPAELLAAVRTAGLDVFSLTDHDSVSGCLEMQKLLSPGDPRFVFGVELSCEEEGQGYHILGYCCDITKPSIANMLERTSNSRRNKAKARFEFLEEEKHFRFSEEEKEAVLAHNNPGKPHFAKLMAKYGYTGYQDAFAILDEYHSKEIKPTPLEGVDAILKADGIPVLAHGILGEGHDYVSDEEIAERVRRLKEGGLMGLEAYYSAYTGHQKEVMLALAEQYNLMVTAGSDYHGSHKTVALGDTNAPDPARMLRFYRAIDFYGR